MQIRREGVLTPTLYAYNKKGLHFHVECIPDAHHCPGNNVRKDDVGLRVSAMMAQLNGGQQPTDAVA